MEQKTFFTILKKTIREEVRNVIKQELSEILKEGLQSTVNELKEETLPKKKIARKTVKKKNVKFKDNNFADILNETSVLSEANGVSNYANMMNESYNSADAQGFGVARQNQIPTTMHDPETGKNMEIDPIVAKALTRDYSSLLKSIDKKQGRK